MKKILLAIASLAVIVSCQKESISEESIPTLTPAEGGVYEFDIPLLSDSDFGPDSKAYKSGWAKGDKMLLFFKNATDGKKYDVKQYAVRTCIDASSEIGEWTTVVPNDFSLNTNKTITLSAMYIPSFSQMFDTSKGGVDANKDGIIDAYEPVLEDGSWTIPCGDVYYSCTSGAVTCNVKYENGHYVITANADGSKSLILPSNFVQFYVTGISTGDYMACDQIESYNSVILNYDGMKASSTDKNSVPEKMRGYDFGDNAGTVFYGQLKSSVSSPAKLEIAHGSYIYSKTYNNKLYGKNAYKIVNPTSSWTKNATGEILK